MSKCLLISVVFILTIATSAFAIPDIQLFIAGATYEWDTQTWVSTSTSIDLYVIGANMGPEDDYIYDDIIVSVALDGGVTPGDMGITFGGVDIMTAPNVWEHDFSPMAGLPGWDGGDDLPPHGIFPTWYTEVHTGPYGLVSNIGDVQPDLDNGGVYWDPSTTPVFPGPPNHLGQWRMFTVDIAGPVGSGVHFDAYTLNNDGSINKFAPFSHDAGTTIIPEPGTILLMGSGLMGMGFGVFRRRKKK